VLCHSVEHALHLYIYDDRCGSRYLPAEGGSRVEGFEVIASVLRSMSTPHALPCPISHNLAQLEERDV
jgi:hypothetical protein